MRRKYCSVLDRRVAQVKNDFDCSCRTEKARLNFTNADRLHYLVAMSLQRKK